MRMCKPHWDRLRQAIIDQGLEPFISTDGQDCANRVKAQLEAGKDTVENYDPLMSAYMAIVGNAMELLRNIGQDPLQLMVENPEHPEWGCPICYLNWLSAEHDRTCTDPNCKKQRGQTFDNWLEDSAKGQAEVIKSFRSTTDDSGTKSDLRG